MTRTITLKIYMVVVIGLGVLLLVLSSVFYPCDRIWSAVFLIVLAMIAETQTIDLGNGKSVSVSSAVVTVAMLTCGPSATLWVAVACVIGSVYKEKGTWIHVFNTDPRKTLFNVGNYAISSSCMAFIYFRFGGKLISSSAYGSFENVMRQFNDSSVQLIAAVVLSVVMNIVLVASFISIRQKVNFFQVLVPNLAWPVTNVIIIGLLGVFLTALFVVYTWFFVVLFFLPFMLARYSFTTYKDLQQNYLQTVESLATAIEAKDAYTSGHSRRVEQYSSMIAQEMKLSGKRCETLRYAALLHDVGKIAIPEKILNKPGKLDQSEWEYIKSHPEKGAHIIEEIEFLSGAVGIVQGHHEWFAGGGYPTGKPAKDMPLEATIICVADAYDAMTSDRPYRSRLSCETAFAELQDKSGTQFSPAVVEAFRRLMIKNGELKPEETAAPAVKAGSGTH